MTRRITLFAFTLLLILGLGALHIGLAQEKNVIDGSVLNEGLDKPYPAPDFVGIDEWIHSDPLTMEKLKGKVVLVDFWTFSCVNCVRTLPYLTKWYDTYKDDGFVIVGVHAPEFGFEKKRENLLKALDEYGITYPIAQDNHFATWKAYKNKYWPAHYLINKEGEVVYTHFGEGKYDVTESNIRYLLGYKGDMREVDNSKPYSSAQTPETYLGTKRAKNESASLENLAENHWFLQGDWTRNPEFIENKNNNETDSLVLNFSAKKVFLVMESADGNPKTVTIDVNGKKSELTISSSRLYTIYEGDKFTKDLITITSQEAGVRLYALTFES